ncbi:MAG: glycosyltransferase family 2 protein [Candidatus Symbiothrix sp.]|jgi:glycosyltransferase involved in cell wall biosynthesis|nr:glycosyltransferase family 2 protein [Candidatus Symbiothrix sp.]
MSTLSILIPAYNEEKTISIILGKIKNTILSECVSKEIIVVDDHSTDSTPEKVKNFISSHPEMCIKYIRLDKNAGKGYALRTAINHSTGDIIIIQDADLEYNPDDYNLLLPYILSGEYQVVYGSRFLYKKNRHSYQRFYWGGQLVSWIANILYSQHLTDEPTCYKMFDATLLKSIPLQCVGFEFCPEITAKVSKLGCKIKEIPIHYYPRSIEEGKKIQWYDGVEAIWTLLRYRFWRPIPA